MEDPPWVIAMHAAAHKLKRQENIAFMSLTIFWSACDELSPLQLIHNIHLWILHKCEFGKGRWLSHKCEIGKGRVKPTMTMCGSHRALWGFLY